MNHGRIVFSQLMDFFPRRRFKLCVDRYRGDHRIRTFTCLDQFYCMAFAQLTGRESLRSDQTIRLTGPKSSVYYPEPLRRVHYVDAELQKRFFFLTNNFRLAPATIARLYKFRWQIELFFKWIKQHLRIKAFCGTTPNAVKTQVWVAISVYVLVAILKKQLGLEVSMYEILQVLSVTLFEKTPIKTLFSPDLCNFPQGNIHNQLLLFDL